MDAGSKLGKMHAGFEFAEMSQGTYGGGLERRGNSLELLNYLWPLGQVIG
jgi:hypothetical protein